MGSAGQRLITIPGIDCNHTAPQGKLLIQWHTDRYHNHSFFPRPSVNWNSLALEVHVVTLPNVQQDSHPLKTLFPLIKLPYF